MLFNLLAAEASGAGLWIGLIILVVFMIAFNSVSNKKRRAQMEEEKQKRGAIEPGFKVTTIGGIMGTVAEVDHEANTFVLITGTAENPSYIKFDKVAIYSSENPNAPVEGEEEFEEEFAEEEVVEETPANEVGEEIAEDTSKQD